MRQKLKFKPVITRIKLNPEQAVLACACYGRGRVLVTTGGRATAASICGAGGSRGVRRSYPRWSTATTLGIAS